MTRRGTAVGLGLIAALATGACARRYRHRYRGAARVWLPRAVDGGHLGPDSGSRHPTPSWPLIQSFGLRRRTSGSISPRPTFSNPTAITNPLFPVGPQASVLHLGTKDGQPLRTEVTTLPYTWVIDWDGLRVEVRVSQYNLFLGGRIEESAIDWNAESDDGAVGFLGEDVANFSDGAVTDTNGPGSPGRTARRS